MSRFKLGVAILLNIVALPGAGQIYLKRKTRGAVYAALVFAVLLALTVQTVSVVRNEIPKINLHSQDVSEMYRVSTALSTNIFAQHETMFQIYFFLLGVCYIVSIADLFWIYQEAL